MAKWKRDGIFIHPLFMFKCLGCKDPKATFSETGFTLCNFPIYNDKPEEYDSHALDRTFKCDLCGYRIVFGIAVSKEHHDAINNWMREEEKKQSDKTLSFGVNERIEKARKRVLEAL